MLLHELTHFGCRTLSAANATIPIYEEAEQTRHGVKSLAQGYPMRKWWGGRDTLRGPALNHCAQCLQEGLPTNPWRIYSCCRRQTCRLSTRETLLHLAPEHRTTLAFLSPHWLLLWWLLVILPRHMALSTICIQTIPELVSPPGCFPWTPDLYIQLPTPHLQSDVKGIPGHIMDELLEVVGGFSKLMLDQAKIW